MIVEKLSEEEWNKSNQPKRPFNQERLRDDQGRFASINRAPSEEKEEVLRSRYIKLIKEPGTYSTYRVKDCIFSTEQKASIFIFIAFIFTST